MKKTEVENIVDDTIQQCENYHLKICAERCELRYICADLKKLDELLERRFKEQLSKPAKR